MRFDRHIVKRIAAVFVVGLCMTSMARSQMTPMQGKFVNISSPGSLAPTHKLLCMDLTDVKNIYTPPDIYTAIRDCLAKGDFNRAAPLYGLASVYAHFDALRVTDQTARDGGQMLSLQTFATATPDQKQAFRQALMATMSDPKKHSGFCSNVSKIGSPNYFPKYMIMHGMNASVNSKPDEKALVPNFDAQGTWTMLQSKYLQCTG